MQLFVDFLFKIVYILPIMTLAQKLAKLRDMHRLSMSQVARISERARDPRGKITQGYISRLESGKETNPSLMKIMTLCSIYKIKPNDLLLKNTPKKFRK